MIRREQIEFKAALRPALRAHLDHAVKMSGNAINRTMPLYIGSENHVETLAGHIAGLLPPITPSRDTVLDPRFADHVRSVLRVYIQSERRVSQAMACIEMYRGGDE